MPSSVDGTGTTIVIIDGFQSPTIQRDLATFDAIWGLPAANLQILTPDGATTPAKSQVPWFIEEAVDVEWAHAIAPGANLILVEAKTGDDADILSATKYAVDNNLGDVISMSFSEAESCPTAAFLADQHSTFQQAVANGTTLVAAAGDNGAAERACNGTLVAGVATPASDPLVTAVGGTSLTADPVSGAYGSEVAWGHGGGGFSSVYRRPGYQAPFQKDNSARGLPDVSLSADVFGFGPSVVLGSKFKAVGTSLATAEWAGITALSDQAAGHRLGLLNVNLYHAAKSNGASDRFHDITNGTNSSTAFAGANAAPGWDAVTGLGTPDVANLVAWIAQTSS
ncbi:MAG TPA: S53 family peptidase [Candidatus Dormibacteraeota bacterium]|nr:S53 family peptidase [Candidatus Dormibacteraeota bacterium]